RDGRQSSHAERQAETRQEMHGTSCGQSITQESLVRSPWSVVWETRDQVPRTHRETFARPSRLRLRKDAAMHANLLKALPIALLLAASSTSLPAASDETPEKKDTTLVVAGDNLSDGEEPFVWTFPGRAGQGRLGVRLLEMTPELRANYGA